MKISIGVRTQMKLKQREEKAVRDSDDTEQKKANQKGTFNCAGATSKGHKRHPWLYDGIRWHQSSACHWRNVLAHFEW